MFNIIGEDVTQVCGFSEVSWANLAIAQRWRDPRGGGLFRVALQHKTQVMNRGTDILTDFSFNDKLLFPELSLAMQREPVSKCVTIRLVSFC